MAHITDHPEILSPSQVVLHAWLRWSMYTLGSHTLGSCEGHVAAKEPKEEKMRGKIFPPSLSLGMHPMYKALTMSAFDNIRLKGLESLAFFNKDVILYE